MHMNKLIREIKVRISNVILNRFAKIFKNIHKISSHTIFYLFSNLLRSFNFHDFTFFVKFSHL